ncbi:hypothetical protein R50073_26760 [Maricurvus nonylphenolicus]|uniref:hypothetical protein n=1 Tax=Maricurvus nonylphenolicus TaxID=1008307 RepID=UPI0036F33772
MCAILGLVLRRYDIKFEDKLEQTLTGLLLASESRGKDATGVCLISDGEIFNLRESQSAKNFVKTSNYKKFINKAKEVYRDEGGITILGHTRLATHGLSQLKSQHQPLVSEGLVVSHNGLVLNKFSEPNELGVKYKSDTELLLSDINSKISSQADVESSFNEIFSGLEGENNLLLGFSDRDVLVGYTNTGSLYALIGEASDYAVLCSEKSYLQRSFISKLVGNERFDIQAIKPGNSICVNIGPDDKGFIVRECNKFSKGEFSAFSRKSIRVVDGNVERKRKAKNEIKRCLKCVLPETMPFIKFNDQGICNYCLTYKPSVVSGEEALRQRLNKYKRKTEPDCIVALSGGRDSCYGLHLLKKKYGMNPIAFTYDWGVVTPLARRNQARMCEKLGVEHIWVAADFKTKRKNVRKNVNAWLKKPELGMVPLFMAGDKEFFVHANRLQKELGLSLMIFSMSPLERTDFKSGFAGVNPYRGDGWHYRMNWMKKAQLALFYITKVASNPRYLNQSLLDSLRAFVAYYFIKQDYLYLFEYESWDEKTINDVLIGEYGWETRSDYSSTWRIGDGTAPFYNYIYDELAGLTENDTLRSNQIRENKLSRTDALRLIEQENRPRWEEIIEYCSLIGVDIDEVINSVERAEAIYSPVLFD